MGTEKTCPVFFIFPQYNIIFDNSKFLGTKQSVFIFHGKNNYLSIMIRVEDKYAYKYTYFPKNRTDFNATSLKLKSEVTLEEYNFKVEDQSSFRGYFTFLLTFSNVPDGEYIYEITGGLFKSYGLIRIGVIGASDMEYKPSRTNIQYTPEF